MTRSDRVEDGGWDRGSGEACGADVLGGLFRTIRLSGLRSITSRARAPAILLHSPVRSLPDCHGLGTRREVNADLVLGDPSISIPEGVILPWGEPSGYLRKVVLPPLARPSTFDLNAPWANIAMHQTGDPLRSARAGEVRDRWGKGIEASLRPSGEALLRNIERRYREANQPMGACHTRGIHDRATLPEPVGGKRLRPRSFPFWSMV